jgi:transposase
VQSVAAHTRRASSKEAVGEADGGVPFFDEARVTIETIAVPNPEIEGLSADQFEVIGEKTSYRLAQRPGSYVVLKYVRSLVKRKDTQAIHCPPAPHGVIDGSRADVSFVAGLIVDKMAYHLPLYRQHRRLQDSGIRVSRPWLTQLIQQGVGLLEPVYAAQLDSIRNSRVKAMDETPIKAGRTDHGKMRTGYFWPVYGGQDEVCFPFFASRHAEHVRALLGATHDADAVLLTDGYAAYDSYAKKIGITHARCWVHCRRKFFEAHETEPTD